MIYKSGLLRLPSQRTLRDYTHVIKPLSGFSDEVVEMLMKEGRLEEWQKRMVFIIDEIHIKEDLVFDKTTGELKGFIKLGNMNNYLLNLESSLSNDASQFANSMSTFIVRVFIDLHFPYTQFPYKNLAGDLLYPLVWEVVWDLESCGFKVFATICDK